MAKSYQQRPSDLLRIEDPLAAFCLDRACHDFGSALESEISRIEGKNQKGIDVKADRLIRTWLDMPLRYRDPRTSGAVALPSKKGDV